MDETTLTIVAGVALLALGSWLRVRSLRRARERGERPPAPQ